MQFDSSSAWDRASSWILANLATLVPIAGIFLLLPGLGFAWFTSDLALQIDAATKAVQPGQINWALLPLTVRYLAILSGIGIVQSIGTMAMLALFSDRSRPTVGQSLTLALRALPSAVAAGLLMLVAGMVASFPVMLVIGLVVAMLTAIGAGPAGAVIAAVLVVGLIMLAAARLTLVTPLIVIERTYNPVTAILRSWTMTRHNTVRLAFFLFLLFTAYLVIALAVQALVGLALGVGMMNDAVQLTAAGHSAQLAAGLISGLVGAGAGVVFTAISGAIYEQFQQASPQGVSGLFD